MAIQAAHDRRQLLATHDRRWRLAHGLPRVSMIRICLLLLLCCCSCNAIFQDEVGVWDWHQQYIGKVTHAVFLTHSTKKKRVVVATEQNVIASLDLRRGEILWRQVLEPYDTIQALDVHGKYIITLSGQGNNLRAWHLTDGQLIWDTELKLSCSFPDLVATTIELKHVKEYMIMVFGAGILYAVSNVDGGIRWMTDTSVASEGGNFTMHKILVSADNSRLYGVGFAATSGFSISAGFSIWKISLWTGEVSLQEAVKIRGNISTDALVVTKDTVIALDPQGKTVVTGHIGPVHSFTVRHTSIHSLLPDISGRAWLLPNTLHGVFTLKSIDQIALLKLAGPSLHDLDVLEKFEQPVVISRGMKLPNNKHVLGAMQHVGFPIDRKVAIRVVILDGNMDETVSELLDLDMERGIAQRIFLDAYERRDKSYGYRVLVVTEDDSLSFLQQGEVVWKREDGLGSIVHAATAELPLERKLKLVEVGDSLLKWLKECYLKVKATLMLSSLNHMTAIQWNVTEKLKMTGDRNGYRKLLIVLTKAGKILAIHTGDGRIVWSSLIPAFRSPPGRQRVLLKLLTWQDSRYLDIHKNPVILVVGKVGPRNDAHGILSWVDAYTGKELESTKLSYVIDQIIPLPNMDSTGQRFHLFIDTDSNGHLFPMNHESLEIFLNEMAKTYFYMVDKDKGVVTGYHITSPKAVSPTERMDGHTFNSEKLWTLVFPNETERIATIACRRQDEVVHAQAEVKSYKDVGYKFVNKNVLFLATVAPTHLEKLERGSHAKACLVAYIIDTITGQILHHVRHINAQGPVSAVFSENWVVYHYFNVYEHRYEVSVMEIYRKNMDNAELRLDHHASAIESSYSHPELSIKSKSYFFLTSIRKMAVTSTANGITPKKILFGTTGDQVLAVDKHILDPDKQLNYRFQEREDGIKALKGSLPIYPHSYLTHAYKVKGLRGIVTLPARLESRSLVFVYGLDLFFTHVAPSHTQESLIEEISLGFLLVTVVALLIAVAVTWCSLEWKRWKQRKV